MNKQDLYAAVPTVGIDANAIIWKWNECKNVVLTVCKGQRMPSSQKKNSKNKKVLLLLQHIAIMSTFPTQSVSKIMCVY